MSAVALAQTIIAFVAIVGVGALLRATGVLTAEDARPLNAVIIYVGLPAFVFRAVYHASLDIGLWRVVAVAWVVFAIILGAALVAARMLRLPPKVAGGFALAAALGNTGYIGYPVTVALMGAALLPVAVFYDVFGTVVALVLVGLVVAQRFGEAEEKPKHPVRELLTFPAVIALALALVLRSVPLPQAVSYGLEITSNMVAPLIMLAVGISLRPRSVGKYGVAIAVLAVLRLVIAPALALAFGRTLIGSSDVLRVTVLEAGMPSMMLTLVIGERFGLDVDFIASAIFVTTALAAISLPLLQLVAF